MIVVENINGREIAIKGVGKLFYQEGVPLEISADILFEKGVEISWLHIADELLKNGWSNKRVYNTLSHILLYSKYESNIPLLKEFIYKEYNEQRDMIFNFLFENKEVAKNWLRCSL